MIPFHFCVFLTSNPISPLYHLRSCLVCLYRCMNGLVIYFFSFLFPSYKWRCLWDKILSLLGYDLSASVHMCHMHGYLYATTDVKTFKHTWNEALKHKQPLIISLPLISKHSLSPFTFSFLSKLSFSCFIHPSIPWATFRYRWQIGCPRNLLCLAVYELEACSNRLYF